MTRGCLRVRQELMSGSASAAARRASTAARGCRRSDRRGRLRGGLRGSLRGSSPRCRDRLGARGRCCSGRSCLPLHRQPNSSGPASGFELHGSGGCGALCRCCLRSGRFCGRCVVGRRSRGIVVVAAEGCVCGCRSRCCRGDPDCHQAYTDDSADAAQRCRSPDALVRAIACGDRRMSLEGGHGLNRVRGR